MLCRQPVRGSGAHSRRDPCVVVSGRQVKWAPAVVEEKVHELTGIPAGARPINGDGPLASWRPPMPAAQRREKVGSRDGRRGLVREIKDTTSGGRRWVGSGAGRSDGVMCDPCRSGIPAASGTEDAWRASPLAGAVAPARGGTNPAAIATASVQNMSPASRNTCRLTLQGAASGVASDASLSGARGAKKRGGLLAGRRDRPRPHGGPWMVPRRRRDRDFSASAGAYRKSDGSVGVLAAPVSVIDPESSAAIGGTEGTASHRGPSMGGGPTRWQAQGAPRW